MWSRMTLEIILALEHLIAARMLAGIDEYIAVGSSGNKEKYIYFVLVILTCFLPVMSSQWFDFRK